jgi:hypothetical protein
VFRKAGAEINHLVRVPRTGRHTRRAVPSHTRHRLKLPEVAVQSKNLPRRTSCLLRYRLPSGDM